MLTPSIVLVFVGVVLVAAPCRAQPPQSFQPQAVVASAAAVESGVQPQRSQFPAITRSRWRRTPAQLIAGTVGGILVGVYGYALFEDRGTISSNAAYTFGSFAGSTAGVYLTGRYFAGGGSLRATAAGTGLATLPLLFAQTDSDLPAVGVVVAAPIQAIVGTVAYDCSIR